MLRRCVVLALSALLLATAPAHTAVAVELPKVDLAELGQVLLDKPVSLNPFDSLVPGAGNDLGHVAPGIVGPGGLL